MFRFVPFRLLVLALGGWIAVCGDSARADEPLPSGAEADWPALGILDARVAPGTRKRLWLDLGRSFEGGIVRTPVVVVRGLRPGPTLCMTAGIHGDELNGVEVVRRVVDHLAPTEISGTVIGVPIVNLLGFRRGSRYLPDRRDLNRHFPGRERGSSASRIAYALFQGVIQKCDALVDMHTGSFHRTNVPHLRADLGDPAVAQLARGFGIGLAVSKEGATGTLRRAATDAGVPTITYEAGEPLRFQPSEVEHGIAGVLNLLASMGMQPPAAYPSPPLPFYMRSSWVRADSGGILKSERPLGSDVSIGMVLGSVTDPLSNQRVDIRSPYQGVLIGKALDQVVIPGFAAYHIAIAGEAARHSEVGAGRPDGVYDANDPDDRPE